MQWRIRVDTGGTFTDAWAIGPDGVERRAKILSDGTLRCRLVAREGEGWITDSELVAPEGSLVGWSCGSARVTNSRDGAKWLKFGNELLNLAPGDIIELSCGDEAPVAVARLLTGTPAGQPLPPVDFRVATTRGTNALLERKGATLGFFTTAGFGDLLVIRDQRRDRLFSLDQPVPEVLPAFTATTPRAAKSCRSTKPLSALPPRKPCNPAAPSPRWRFSTPGASRPTSSEPGRSCALPDSRRSSSRPTSPR